MDILTAEDYAKQKSQWKFGDCDWYKEWLSLQIKDWDVFELKRSIIDDFVWTTVAVTHKWETKKLLNILGVNIKQLQKLQKYYYTIKMQKLVNKFLVEMNLLTKFFELFITETREYDSDMREYENDEYYEYHKKWIQEKRIRQYGKNDIRSTTAKEWYTPEFVALCRLVMRTNKKEKLAEKYLNLAKFSQETKSAGAGRYIFERFEEKLEKDGYFKYLDAISEYYLLGLNAR